LKDTAGPALNSLIKVVNLVSLIMAPVIVKSSQSTVGPYLIALVLLVAVGWAISSSKKPAKKLE